MEVSSSWKDKAIWQSSVFTLYSSSDPIFVNVR